jgi:hypothetical protein
VAAAYEDELLEWLPDAITARLVAAHDGRDTASINAFCAAEGLSKTVVIAVTESGASICGAYLDPAWREEGESAHGGYLDPAWRMPAWARDNRKSFLFTLKNHAGVGPTKFPKKGSDPWAAYKWLGSDWHFGDAEGPYIYEGGNPGGGLGIHYEDVVGQGQAIFNGGQDFFRLARWELWQVA